MKYYKGHLPEVKEGRV